MKLSLLGCDSKDCGGAQWPARGNHCLRLSNIKHIFRLSTGILKTLIRRYSIIIQRGRSMEQRRSFIAFPMRGLLSKEKVFR